jgi:hypothetical protein
MNETIFDLSFGICDWATGGGNPGSSHDRGQYAGVLVQRLNEFDDSPRRPIANRKSEIANP